jgi:MFS family permease
VRDLRWLLALLAASMVVDTATYSAITPLLPHLAEHYDLSRVGIGLLAAAYPVGTMGLALPAAWLVARVGPKKVTIISLTLVALASLGFALADASALLGVARFTQGCGAAGLWAAGLAWAYAVAPANRRSEAMGTVVGAAIIGAVGGPVLGSLGERFGVQTVFAIFVVVPVALALLVMREPGPPPTHRTIGWRTLRGAFTDSRVTLGVWLMVVGSLSFAVISLLVPLRLDARGWGAAAIGGVFLFAAITESFASPVAGRAADRFGPHRPAWLGLALGAAGLALLAPPSPAFVIAALVPLTGALLGTLWTPAMTLLTAGIEDRGVDAAFGFGLANLFWGVGTGFGDALGGGLAEVAGDWAAFAAVALVAALSAAFVRAAVRRSELPAALKTADSADRA